MRRLFSTFASGAPGAGLLLMRAAAGGALAANAVASIDAVVPWGMTVILLAQCVVGGLLFLGLWTPIAGVLAALGAAWIVYSRSGDAAFWLLVGAVDIALALLGPGAWSIDARLFGWRRVDIRDRNGNGSPRG